MLATLVFIRLLSGPVADGFAAPFRVSDAAGFIDVDAGHAAPLMADIDGDGLADLLVGQFDGGKLRVYKNVGTKKESKFQGFTWLEAGGQLANVPVG